MDKPDIITKHTKLIDLGNLKEKLVNINDDLIEEDKKSNDSTQSGYWLNLDDSIYYLKVAPFTQGYINELLGEKISLEFGLETVHNQLATGIIKHQGKETKIYGLLSKWARKPDYDYHILKNVIYKNIKRKLPDSSNLSILEYIDETYKNQPICGQMRSFITREFFTQETDRLDNELLIATKDKKVELGFLSDYEFEWLETSSRYSLYGMLNLDTSDEQTIQQIQQDQFFQAAFTKALEIDVVYLLEQIQEEHKIRLIDYDKNNYSQKAHIMKRIIKTKKLLK